MTRRAEILMKIDIGASRGTAFAMPSGRFCFDIITVQQFLRKRKELAL